MCLQRCEAGMSVINGTLEPEPAGASAKRFSASEKTYQELDLPPVEMTFPSNTRATMYGACVLMAGIWIRLYGDFSHVRNMDEVPTRSDPCRPTASAYHWHVNVPVHFVDEGPQDRRNTPANKRLLIYIAEDVRYAHRVWIPSLLID